MPVLPLRLGYLAIAAALVLPSVSRAQGPGQEPESYPSSTFALPPKSSYWGAGMGYVFNKVPISMSTFNVVMSNLWYSHLFSGPDEKFRVAGTLGFYGFQILLPVPRVAADIYLGRPTQDIQFKGGIGGFYDIAVGGHGGLSLEAGAVVKNRVEISFMTVPAGTDSERSYAEFAGLKTQEEADVDYKKAGNQWVEMPYYGLMVGVRF